MGTKISGVFQPRTALGSRYRNVGAGCPESIGTIARNASLFVERHSRSDPAAGLSFCMERKITLSLASGAAKYAFLVGLHLTVV